MGVYIASMLFPAISAIFKEKIFEDAKQKLNGRTLDLFAVNSFGSAAQALFVLLLLPVLSSLRGIPIDQLPNYVREGKHPYLEPTQNLNSVFEDSNESSNALAMETTSRVLLMDTA